MEIRLTPAQVRGARVMLGWSMFELAKNAKVSVSTVKRIETDEPRNDPRQSLALIADCLSRAGATFMPDDGDGPGVRVK